MTAPHAARPRIACRIADLLGSALWRLALAVAKRLDDEPVVTARDPLLEPTPCCSRAVGAGCLGDVTVCVASDPLLFLDEPEHDGVPWGPYDRFPYGGRATSR